MKKVKVTRADVYAARTRVQLDRQEGKRTEPWIVKLAAVCLPHERRD